jgi:type II secretory pathway pseudopilin PulG
MMKMFSTRRGITLIELLVAMVLTALSVSVASRIYITSRQFVGRAEFKAKAGRIAFVKMEEYLARSYASLDELIQQGQTDFSGIDSADTRFQWAVQLASKQEINASDTSIKIPYVEIGVTVTYPDSDSSSLSTRSLRITNIVPYPYYRVYSINCDFTKGCFGNSADCATGSAFTTCPPLIPLDWSWHRLASITLENKTKVDLLVIYNIGIAGVPGTGVAPDDCIFTMLQIAFDSDPFYWHEARGENAGITTGTPILSQPFISNMDVVKDVVPADPAHPRYLEVMVHRDPDSEVGGGQIEVKWVNCIVIEIST